MRLLFVFTLASITLLGTMTQALATTDFNAYLPINGAPITPTFKFTRVVYLDYPQGGNLKNALDGKNMTVSFTADASNNPSVKNLMNEVTEVMNSEGSSVQLTNMNLNYVAQISGGPTEASITYLIEITPTVDKYVLYHGTAVTQSGLQGGGTPFIMDAAWVGFNLNKAATISTQQYGDLEINFPINLIQKELPSAYNVIKGTQAEKLLQQNLINPSTLYQQQSLDKWDSLFDPSYTVSDSAVLNYKGAKVAVTTFSTGVSNLQSGTMQNNQQDVDFTTDAKYHIRTIDQPASGTFNVEGHAKAYNVKGAPAFTTTVTAASNVSNTTAGGLSNMITYGFAAGAAGIAVFIFMWSNKKMKQKVYDVEVGPLRYETRQHWADKFESSNIESSQNPTYSSEKRSPI